jgi:hypothetical protein
VSPVTTGGSRLGGMSLPERCLIINLVQRVRLNISFVDQINAATNQLPARIAERGHLLFQGATPVASAMLDAMADRRMRAGKPEIGMHLAIPLSRACTMAPENIRSRQREEN